MSHEKCDARSGGMLIGDVSRVTGVPTKTIRYYEKLGLLDPPGRTASGYRAYNSRAVEQLKFITGAKVLGLSLAEIQEALTTWRSGHSPCATVKRLVTRKLDELDRKLDELQRYRDQLRGYLTDVEEKGIEEASGCIHVQGVLQGVWAPDVPVPREELEIAGKRAGRKRTRDSM